MVTVEQIEMQRKAIVEELLSIRALEKGTLAQQKWQRPPKGQEEPVQYGPYYVLARWVNGKTVSRRLTSPEAVAQARADVEAHRRFQALCKQLEELTYALGQLERESRTDDLAPTAKKKATRRLSSRTRK